MEKENQTETSLVQTELESGVETIVESTPPKESSPVQASGETLNELLTTPAQKIVNQMPYHMLMQMKQVTTNQMEALNIMSLVHAYCLEKKLIEENDAYMLTMQSFIAKEYQAIQAFQHLVDIAYDPILNAHPERPKPFVEKKKNSKSTNNSSITNSIVSGMNNLTQKTAENFAKKTANFVPLFE